VAQQDFQISGKRVWQNRNAGRAGEGGGRLMPKKMGHPEYVWNALAAQQKTPLRPKSAPPDIKFSHFPHPHGPNLASSVNPRLGWQRYRANGFR
jgi:hypothetical protein